MLELQGVMTVGRPAFEGFEGGLYGTSARQGEGCSEESFIGLRNRKHRAMSTVECQEWERKR
jgi:hypothetical protein